MKKVIGIYSAPRQHWVGDGFPVRSLFSYHSHGKALSPFLLLDRAGPAEFEPGDHARGVGQHPHRGFETVTIVYEGEVAHRDSTGQGGVIGSGDVQWMSAAAGIMHEEFHSEAFTRAGGTLDMVQLWVNLPARDKMSAPGYQAIRSDSIPEVALPDGAGSVRLIAGDYAGRQGPARTFSPMNVWDLRLKAGASLALPAVDGWNTAIVVLKGSVCINGQEEAGEAQLVLLDPRGSDLQLETREGAVLLLLSGEPIDEPIVGYGPFVMNSQEEITQAIDDFNSGRFANIAH
ncbi:pirin family protein [Aeromonas sp. sif2416]|uniref:pirin family protein n=1 Tax=Aeromonas sp. sif2416 TaxID=2854793 RepID=UPI001C48CB57|nr:pirin family protein [Aeromonas sp. sif2416]MBV7437709.1 pirin family protein [Aeromonas sp. sif2416]